MIVDCLSKVKVSKNTKFKVHITDFIFLMIGIFSGFEKGEQVSLKNLKKLMKMIIFMTPNNLSLLALISWSFIIEIALTLQLFFMFMFCTFWRWKTSSSFCCLLLLVARENRSSGYDKLIQKVFNICFIYPNKEVS